MVVEEVWEIRVFVVIVMVREMISDGSGEMIMIKEVVDGLGVDNMLGEFVGRSGDGGEGEDGEWYKGYWFDFLRCL